MPKPWTPREYQLEALEFALARDYCGLMLDPGLGKTSTTLAATSLLKERGEIKRTLVCAPLRVAKEVWSAEIQKWSDFNHLKLVHLCEMNDLQRLRLLEDQYDIYTINPESLHKVLEFNFQFDMLVIDESTKFKDSSTQRFKFLKKHLVNFKRRMILTGTPAPNGLQDLFGQVYVLDLGKRLGQYITHFRARYMQKSYDGYSYDLIPGADKAIYDQIGDIILRQRAKDHLDMPELLNNYIEVTLPPKARKHYEEVELEFLTKLTEDNSVVAFNTASAGVKCRQISNGFVYDNEKTPHNLHDEKLEALEELVEEMQGRPLLVFYEFIQDRVRIKNRIKHAVDINDNPRVGTTIMRFNKGEIPVLIAHPASAGHGLNLQESCHTVCWYGVTWNLEHYQQAIARVWRQGQPSNEVIVHHIVGKDTVDQVVLKALEKKDKTQESLNEALVNFARTKV